MLNQLESECLSNILKKDYKILSEKQRPYVENIYERYKNSLSIEIVNNQLFGLNFAFKSTRGVFYFPAALWYVQSYKTTKKNIDEINIVAIKNLKDLENLFFSIVEDKRISRKGYSIELMESLNFYSDYYSDNEYDIDTLINSHITDYRPNFLLEFNSEILKNNWEHLNQTIETYLVPNNEFWNLGSIIFDPFFDYNNCSYEYPLFPYWLIGLKDNNYLRIFRASTKDFGNKFEFKNQIINEIDFFINFRYYLKSKSDLFSFSVPDLFKTYEIFEEQNFSLLNKKEFSVKGLKEPNWYLSTKTSKNIQNQKMFLDNNENDIIKHFLIENLDLIINLFNNSRVSQRLNLEEIIIKYARKNIFNEIFHKRIRLKKNNFNIEFILFLKIEKHRLIKYKLDLKKFFSSIFPTGIIIDYNSGLMIKIFVYHEKKVNLLRELKNFLDFFNIEYKIFSKFHNFGFLTYWLPPSEYFKNGLWNFPKMNIKLMENEFNKIMPLILEKEKKIENLEKNILRIKNFSNFISNL